MINIFLMNALTRSMDRLLKGGTGHGDDNSCGEILGHQI